jgi:hypothetical protein
MPIPPLDENGFLPPGLHPATLDEIKQRFGRFQQSDRRPQLLASLLQLIAATRSSELFEALLIDGSFVTAKSKPNDVDIIAVLRPGHSFERELSIAEYALVSRTLLQRRFGFDVIVAERKSAVYDNYVEFFSRVREAPDLRKGLLELKL